MVAYPFTSSSRCLPEEWLGAPLRYRCVLSRLPVRSSFVLHHSNDCQTRDPAKELMPSSRLLAWSLGLDNPMDCLPLPQPGRHTR